MVSIQRVLSVVHRKEVVSIHKASKDKRRPDILEKGLSGGSQYIKSRQVNVTYQLESTEGESGQDTERKRVSKRHLLSVKQVGGRNKLGH